MNPRFITTGALTLLAMGMLAAVFVQGRQLSGLRAERDQRLAHATAPPDSEVAATSDVRSEHPPNSDSAPSQLSELLNLRSQISQLTTRQRELAPLRSENDQLSAQLAARGTNSPFPSGYIRASQAQWMGMNTVENTVQSFLWTLRNRDVTNLLRVLTPEVAEAVQQMINRSPDEFFKQTQAIPAMRIVSQKPLPDGSIEVQLDTVVEGRPNVARFRQIQGEWRMELH